MTGVEKILQKFELKKGMSINSAITQCSRHIDDHFDPLKESNAIISTLQVPTGRISDAYKAKIVALASIEQALVMDIFKPVEVAAIADVKFNRMKAKFPFMFERTVVDIVGETPTSAPSKGKRGAKRDIARQIYLANKDKNEKEIIALVAKELDVTMQNAYTYIYLIKKETA